MEEREKRERREEERERTLKMLTYKGKI